MIQELENTSIDITYKNIKPEKEDFIISVKNGCVLFSGRHDDSISFPRLKNMKAVPANIRYLFKIGSEKYFLVNDADAFGEFEYQRVKYSFTRRMKNKKELYTAALAVSLSNWYETTRFCGKCGASMVHDKKERMMFCPECGVIEYPRICPCIIAGVINNGKILVTKYRGSTSENYALVAGFAEAGETIEQCAIREVYEETHVKIKNLKFYRSQPWPYSSSLLFGFFCELDGDEDIEIEPNELSMAKFVSPEEITEEFNDCSLTNEMLCKFRDDMLTYGKLL
ncbi:MAG: NAD(+) diphosphatase [Lachnospiraceae bacterium]|jgi:NAD+ diphosphatase